MQESQDKRKIMWRKTLTNSLSHSGPDSPLSHCSSMPRQVNCLKWVLHQCKCCLMFWINPPHLLIGLISESTQCQETVIWIVQPMHLQHYLQLCMSHKYSCFTLCLGAGSSPLYFAEPWDFPPTFWVIFTPSHTHFILLDIKCRIKCTKRDIYLRIRVTYYIYQTDKTISF